MSLPCRRCCRPNRPSSSSAGRHFFLVSGDAARRPGTARGVPGNGDPGRMRSRTGRTATWLDLTHGAAQHPITGAWRARWRARLRTAPARADDPAVRPGARPDHQEPGRRTLRPRPPPSRARPAERADLDSLAEGTNCAEVADYGTLDVASPPDAQHTPYIRFCTAAGLVLGCLAAGHPQGRQAREQAASALPASRSSRNMTW